MFSEFKRYKEAMGKIGAAPNRAFLANKNAGFRLFWAIIIKKYCNRIHFIIEIRLQRKT